MHVHFPQPRPSFLAFYHTSILYCASPKVIRRGIYIINLPFRKHGGCGKVAKLTLANPSKEAVYENQLAKGTGWHLDFSHVIMQSWDYNPSSQSLWGERRFHGHRKRSIRQPGMWKRFRRTEYKQRREKGGPILSITSHSQRHWPLKAKGCPMS